MLTVREKFLLIGGDSSFDLNFRFDIFGSVQRVEIESGDNVQNIAASCPIPESSGFVWHNSRLVS